MIYFILILIFLVSINLGAFRTPFRFWYEISEKSFVQGCLGECFHGDFYKEFVNKNSKLY